VHGRVAKTSIKLVERTGAARTASGERDIHPVDRHVGQQLRIRRIHSNLSQTELGAKIGLSYQQIQKYESGKNRISASMLYEFAGGLNVPVAQFFEGLPQPDAARYEALQSDVDERIAYLTTTEGRRFVEEILRLSPRLRTRTYALIKTLAAEDEGVSE
jgi:transcriptional regulator with XRE-family HTH domain